MPVTTLRKLKIFAYCCQVRTSKPQTCTTITLPTDPQIPGRQEESNRISLKCQLQIMNTNCCFLPVDGDTSQFQNLQLTQSRGLEEKNLRFLQSGSNLQILDPWHYCTTNRATETWDTGKFKKNNILMPVTSDDPPFKTVKIKIFQKFFLLIFWENFMLFNKYYW